MEAKDRDITLVLSGAGGGDSGQILHLTPTSLEIRSIRFYRLGMRFLTLKDPDLVGQAWHDLQVFRSAGAKDALVNEIEAYEGRDLSILLERRLEQIKAVVETIKSYSSHLCTNNVFDSSSCQSSSL